MSSFVAPLDSLEGLRVSTFCRKGTLSLQGNSSSFQEPGPVLEQEVHLSQVTVSLGCSQIWELQGHQGQPVACPQPLSCRLAPEVMTTLQPWAWVRGRFCPPVLLSLRPSRYPPPQPGHGFCALRGAGPSGRQSWAPMPSAPSGTSVFCVDFEWEAGPRHPRDRFPTAPWVVCCSLNSQLLFAHSSCTLEASACFALWTHYLLPQSLCSGL